MKCYQPIQAWLSKGLNENGKRPLVFEHRRGNGDSMLVPCGTCNACKLVRSNEWAIRCMHENSMYRNPNGGFNSSFITLTLNDQNVAHITENITTLNKYHLKCFFKNLRYHTGSDIRYFAGGEYGTVNGRPHYHALIFGENFNDKQPLFKRGPNQIYRSPILEKVWKKGFNTVGNVSYQSAAYVARYCMKKQHGEDADNRYKFVMSPDGDVYPFDSPEYRLNFGIDGWNRFKIQEEFQVQSLKPAIGAKWLEKNWKDISNDGYIVICKPQNGQMQFFEKRIPRYYKKWLEQHPEGSPQNDKFQEIKAATLEYIKNHPDDWYMLDRKPTLKSREILAKRAVVELPRELDVDQLEITT